VHAQHFLAMLAREKDAASQEMAAAFEHVRKVSLNRALIEL
jgi:hypothetical protein